MTKSLKRVLSAFSLVVLLAACGGGGGGAPEGSAVFSVTPSASTNGNTSPDKPVQVTAGGTTLFRINPNPGFVASVGGTCPGTLIGSTYTVGPITGDCTVSASFSPITYTVTPLSGQNGTIKPNTPQSVFNGSPKIFEITPGSGYSIDSVSGCDGTLAGNIFTTAPITGNCTVSAGFTPIQYSTAILSLSVATKPSDLGFLEMDIPLPSGVQPASMTQGAGNVFDIAASVTPSPFTATYTTSTNTIKLLFLNYNSGIVTGSLASVHLSVALSTFVTPASFPSFATVLSATDMSINNIATPNAVITIPLSVTLN